MTKGKDVRRLARAAVSGVGKSRVSRVAKKVALDLFSVSSRSVRRWNAQEKITGSADPVHKQKHRPSGVPDSVWEGSLRPIFLLEPRLPYEEAANELFFLVHMQYTGRQIKTACLSRGWTRKAISDAAKERDETLRAAFLKVIRDRQFEASQMVILDESMPF
jgi:hypothetical protein